MGLVEPTIDAYKKFAKYASDKGYTDKNTGYVSAMDKLIADYGATLSRKYSGEEGWKKYQNLLENAKGGEYALVRGGGHTSVSRMEGNGKDVAIDTGYYENSGFSQRDKGTNAITKDNFESLFIIKRNE